MGICLRMLDIPFASVALFCSHTAEARGLKIGMHNSYIDGSKVTIHFDILPRSLEI